MKWYVLGVLIWNMIIFILFGLDKGKAKRKRRRIPESSLWIGVALVGALGGLLGMLLFRHKIRKPAFRFGIPVLLIFQIIVLIYIF